MKPCLWVVLGIGVGCGSAPKGGAPCEIVRVVDGGELAFTNAELVPGREYVSFGTPECLSGICLRDATFTVPGAGPGDPAMGYCSAPCGSVGSTCASVNPAITLTCQVVILDGRAVEASADGGVSTSTSPGWPNLCAR